MLYGVYHMLDGIYMYNMLYYVYNMLYTSYIYLRSANPCPALGGRGADDRHILVIFLILGGGGGMILRFLISGSCYAETHAFSTHFIQIFLDDFFLLARLFSHISCRSPLKPINIYHILHLPYPQIFFGASMVEKGVRSLCTKNICM